MRGKSAAAISWSAFFTRAMVKPMLDCPEPIQTSPIRTSFTIIVFWPATVSSSGPPGSSGFRKIFHFPVASAVVEDFWSRKVTVIDSPGSARPQMRTGALCWMTMRSEITAGRVMFAWAVASAIKMRSAGFMTVQTITENRSLTFAALLAYSKLELWI